ncbi:SusD/RagB family nutrient-binding outer membrane lipoprotein [soil metagenome]
MKKVKIIIILALGFFTFNACETLELDNLESPNALNPSQANVDLYMNGTQVRFAFFVNGIGSFGSALTRVTNMFGRSYPDVYGPSTFNGTWNTAYSIIKDLREMRILAEESGQSKHIGVAKVIEAYVMIALVDHFGDVPYSEAFDVTNLNPAPDSGEAIYAAVRVLLDEAITDLQAEGGGRLANDLYYNNNFGRWVKAANTLKMKTFITTRLVDGGAIAAFEALVAQDNYIKTPAENFVFNWGSNLDNPNSRHPFYNGAYAPGGTSGYRSNWLLNVMKNEYAVTDPRMRFYFYRQVSDVRRNVDPAAAAQLRCILEPIPAHYEAGDHVFCVIPDDQGYWGRDHGDNSGIPPDAFLKTAWGLYPAGGRFDDNSFARIDGNNYGAEGAGITPIMLAATVDFWRAEAVLAGGGSGDASAHLANGVTKSINYVKSFISRNPGANAEFVPDAERTTAYVADVVSQFTGANGQGKFDVLGEQLFISVYGNGIEAYNYYRRTGAPSDIQPNIEPNPGPFVRSFWYPANEVSANASINQKETIAKRVFWDTNPQTGFPPNN